MFDVVKESKTHVKHCTNLRMIKANFSSHLKL